MIAVQNAEGDALAGLEEAGSSLPLLIDPSGRVASDYGVSAIPTTVAIDAAGHIISTRVGSMTADQIAGMVNGN